MALGLVALAIIIERLLYLHRIHTDEEKLFLRVKTSLMEGHYTEALAICDQNISPFSMLFKVGIENRNQPEYVQKELLKDAASLESVNLERNLTTLGTISNVSTLLGLLGTVTGTMRAFGVLSTFGAVSDPAQLAGGVAEALITTVGGLVVAIPIILVYNYLVSKVNLIMTRMETQVNSLVAFIATYNNKAAEKPSEGGIMAKSRRLTPKINFDLTPLIDIVLQLVIFFMITTTFRTSPGIMLQLPSSQTAQSIATPELRIVVMSSNEIYVDKTRTDIANLQAVLKKRISGSSAKQIHAQLEGSSQAEYQLIISVLDALRMNGIENVGLITRKEKAVQ